MTETRGIGHARDDRARTPEGAALSFARQRERRIGMRAAGMLAALVCLAGDGMVAEPARQFTKGDRVVFIGDSITHGDAGAHDYHTFIYLFYATRFPDRKFVIYDSGIGGDKASDAMARFSWDVADYKPTICTIMFGMNDATVCYTTEDGFGAPDVNAEVLKAAETDLQMYRNNMTQLLQLVKKAGAEPMLITSSPYDETAVLKENQTPRTGKNRAIGVFGQCLGKLAEQFKAPVVDFWTPMTELALERQRRDPSFTLTRPADRTHPERVGHFVMAYLFLKAQQAPRYVSLVALNARNGQVSKTENCEIKNVAAKGNTVTFSLLAKALPFPASLLNHLLTGAANAEGIPAQLEPFSGSTGKEVELAMELVPFMQEMNQEVLQLTDVAPGRYVLSIDGQDVGAYTAAELATGINLAANEKTPEYQQALDVARVNLERGFISSVAFRSIAFVKSKMLRGGIQELPFEEQIASLKKTCAGKGQYYEGMVDAYGKYLPREDQVKKQYEALVDRLYEVNQPRWRVYEIKPATGSDL